MRQLLKEKILLEEDTIIDDEKKYIDDRKRYACDFLSNEMSNTYANITTLKDYIIALSDKDSFGGEVPEEFKQVIDILNEIVDSRTINIGMLQKAISILDNKQQDLIDMGKQTADEIANNPEANDLNKGE